MGKGDAPKIQVSVVVMMVYAVSAAINGIVVYDRQAYLYEVVKRVVRTNVCFAVMGDLALKIGQFMDSWS